MSDEKGYNGWTNYETWAVALWFDNDQYTHNHCRSMAQDAWDEAEQGKYAWQTREQQALYALTESLKDMVEESNPLADSADLYSDLLNAALSEVDWRSIAEHYMDDVDKEEEALDEEEEALAEDD